MHARGTHRPTWKFNNTRGTGELLTVKFPAVARGEDDARALGVTVRAEGSDCVREHAACDAEAAVVVVLRLGLGHVGVVGVGEKALGLTGRETEHGRSIAITVGMGVSADPPGTMCLSIYDVGRHVPSKPSWEECVGCVGNTLLGI
jgi:hypothetical protein